jgi:hypothetical protein
MPSGTTRLLKAQRFRTVSSFQEKGFATAILKQKSDGQARNHDIGLLAPVERVHSDVTTDVELRTASSVKGRGVGRHHIRDKCRYSDRMT